MLTRQPGSRSASAAGKDGSAKTSPMLRGPDPATSSETAKLLEHPLRFPLGKSSGLARAASGMAGRGPEHAGTDRASAALPKEELAFIGVVLAEQPGKTHTQSPRQAGSKKSHLTTQSQDGFGLKGIIKIIWF